MAAASAGGGRRAHADKSLIRKDNGDANHSRARQKSLASFRSNRREGFWTAFALLFSEYQTDRLTVTTNWNIRIPALEENCSMKIWMVL